MEQTKLPVNPFTLSFKTAGVEGDFRYYHSERLLTQSRIGMGVLAAFFLAIAIYEMMGRPDASVYRSMAYVGLSFGAAITLVLTFVDNIYLHRQKLLVLLALIVSAASAYLSQDVSPRTPVDIAVPIITMFWVWVLSGLRLPMAMLVGIVVVISQIMILWFKSSQDQVVLISEGSIIGITALFSLFAAYQSEKTSRQIFFEFYRARETQSAAVSADVMTANASTPSQQEGDWAQTLKDLTVELSAIHDMDLMFNKLLSFMEQIIPNDAATVGLYKENKIKAVVSTGALMGPQSEGIRNTMWDENLVKQLEFAKDGLAKETNTGLVDGRLVRRNKNFAYRLDIPIYSQKRLVGVASLLRQDNAFDSYEIKIASSCIFHAMTALKNARMQQKLASQASSQAIATNTGAPDVAPAPNTVPLSSAPLSHKLFREKAKPLFEKAIKADRGVSILVVEIDQLTELYEKHGEKVARNVYALVARLLRNAIGLDDLLAYYGKTGFASMLIDKDILETQKLAQEVDAKLKQQKLKVADGEINVTVSVGISTFTEEAQDFMAILRAADMALFLVRETGGDGIRVNL